MQHFDTFSRTYFVQDTTALYGNNSGSAINNDNFR